MLVIEDHEADAFLTTRAIERGGFEIRWRRVDTAADLDDALREPRWDVVLCDSAMPHLSVPDVVLRVSRHAPAVPIVLVSGRGAEELERMLGAYPIAGAVTKDQLPDLPTLLDKLLPGTRSTTEA